MAAIDSQRFYKELDSKKFKPMYFLFGDEPYLLNQCIERFKRIVLDQNTVDFNLSMFYANETDFVNIKDTVETLPVFSSHRLVFLKNTESLKDKDWVELEKMALNQIDSTVFVVIYSEKMDKRKRFFKSMLDNVTCVEFNKPFSNQVPQWISYIAKNLQIKITNDAIHRLHKLLGNNLIEIESQLSRLREYIGERNLVEISDVNAVVSVSREESVFDFTDAIGKKDRVQALEQLVNLLDQGQTEQSIVALVARHMRILMMVKEGLNQGIGGAKLASLVGVAPYFIDSYCDQSKLWSPAKIEDSLIVLHETDKAIKSSPLSSHIWLENLVLKSCSL